jgi:hypothetical protein
LPGAAHRRRTWREGRRREAGPAKEAGGGRWQLGQGGASQRPRWALKEAAAAGGAERGSSRRERAKVRL